MRLNLALGIALPFLVAAPAFGERDHVLYSFRSEGLGFVRPLPFGGTLLSDVILLRCMMSL